MVKCFKKGIIYFLIFALSLNSFPVYVLASIFEAKKSRMDIINEKEKIEEIKVVGEIEEKRTLNEKHYLMSDGTINAAIYPENVHYEKNGKMIDIDNTLVETKSGFKVKSNNLDLEFFNNENFKSKNNNTLSISNNGYKLKWSIEETNIEKSKILLPKQNKFLNILNKGETSEIELDSIKSELTYKEIIKDIDLKYDIVSNKVEESIIINKKEAVKDTFTYNIEVEGLTIKQNKDNELILLDKDNNIIFYIEAPCMYDANYEYSDSVKLLPTKTEYGYSIKMELDKEWLNSNERVYPIVIDPIISTSKKAKDIKDTYIYNGDSNNKTKGTAHILRVGNTNASSSSKRPFRSLIQFELPNLNSGDQVIGAYFYIHNYNYPGSTTAPKRSIQIDVHAVTESWNETAAYWNTMNTKYNSNIADYFIYKYTTSNQFKQNRADITSIVKDWYINGNNYGLMLKEHNETNNGTESDAHFIASDTSTSYHNYRPSVIINYRNQTGLEGYLTTHKQEIGRTTTYTNDYNGNLTLIHNDATTPGNRLPVSIYHIYNTNDKDTNIGYGNGFRLNLNQTLEYITIGSLNYIKYIDEEGTIHYFYKDGTIWKDEDGLELTITEDDSNLIMKDKEGNKSTYIRNSNKWYLKYIDDVNGNRITINYNLNNYNLITSVIDAVGDTIALNYTNNLLNNIKDPANRTITYTYAANRLTNIKYPDNLNTIYTYTSLNLIDKITNVDGSSIKYTYYGVRPYRIKSVTEYGINNNIGNSYNITYGSNTTTLTDIRGNSNTYTFNNLGQTTSITSNGISGNINNAYGISYQYGKDNGNKNKLILETNMIKATNNYILNSSAENDLDNW